MVRLVVVLLLAQHFEVVSDCGGSNSPPVNDPPVTQLAMGGFHGCGVEAGALRCWGANDRGQLGLGTAGAAELRPRDVSLEEPVAQVVTGERSTCARTVTGRVWCWGDNGGGQLGSTEPAFSATPIEISVPAPVASIALDSDYVLALGSDGRLFGWGNSAEGTLGRDDPRPEGYPVKSGVVRAAFELKFKSISSGQGHACGIDRSNTLWCWGRNVRREIGVGQFDHQLRKPTRVFENVSSVAAGAFGTCAISGGEPLCWGDMPIDDQGQAITNAAPAAMWLGGAEAREIDGMWFHGCVTTTDDRLFCWGRGIEGQLGDGRGQPTATPIEITGDVASFATGFFSTCLRRTSGAIECMGANDQGQLGLGDTNRRSTPTPQ